MKKLTNRLSAAGIGLTLAMTSIGGLSASALATSSQSDPSRYIAPLHPLNRSGATGMANLTLNGEQPGASLTASVNARGTEPNQIHAIHIHGMLDGKNAECPTNSADVNNDRFVSVFEGAPFYGPIKVNFTNPMTAFGPPANTTLFAPFAGSPTLGNFPKADESGRVSYNNTISFDPNNPFAMQALTSLMPLEKNHIVVHGGFAPESVDTAGGDPNKLVYDALLPVACGQIIQTHRGSSNNQGNNGNQNGSSAVNSGTSITTAGPNSPVSTTTSTRSTLNATNNNNVRATSTTSQRSTTGNAAVSGNTSGGSANSGSSFNSSINTFMTQVFNSIFSQR